MDLRNKKAELEKRLQEQRNNSMVRLLVEYLGVRREEVKEHLARCGDEDFRRIQGQAIELEQIIKTLTTNPQPQG